MTEGTARWPSGLRQFPESAGAVTRVGVVVLNWNGLDDTLECVASLRRVSWEALDVIVVDNGSTDGSAAALRDLGGELQFIETGSNLGYAGGNNRGIVAALEGGADYVWILNNDTTVEPGSIASLVGRMREDPSVGICGSTLLYYDEPSLVQAYGGATYDPWTARTRLVGQFERYEPGRTNRTEVESSLNLVSGAALFVSRTFIESVGLMSEDYFLFFEELDWATRGQPRFRLGWAPDSIVFHKEGRTSGTHRDAARRSELADFYGVRSRFLYASRHTRWALPVLILSLGVVLANRIRRGQVQRIPTLLRAAASGLGGTGVAATVSLQGARFPDSVTDD